MSDFMMYTNLIYGFVVCDKRGNPIERIWEKEPEQEDLDTEGITLIHFGPNLIPVLGINESHKALLSCIDMHLGEKLEAKPEWKEALKKFCDKHRIRFDDPDWLVVVSYD